jgi:mRNA interferase MazF
VKRGLYTIHQALVVKSVGRLSAADSSALENSLRGWLGIRRYY